MSYQVDSVRWVECLDAFSRLRRLGYICTSDVFIINCYLLLLLILLLIAIALLSLHDCDHQCQHFMLLCSEFVQ